MNTKKITAGIGAGLALLGGGTMTADQIANPYTDKGAVMELRASSTLPFSGDVVAEVVKDRPEVRLKKWDDVTLSIRHDDVKAKGDRKFLTDKIEWKQGKKEVHTYPLEATPQMEDGGIEFEVVLNEKPDTNVFDFQIDGAENLDFFYQPELTPEEIAEGVERAENVIGSYAVYHKTKRNHAVGDTNYATGKAFHIFRPKAIDANGVEVWGTLAYTNGVLSVTVPQDFLDTATYPVKVDPTFGYTSLGGTSQPLSNAIAQVTDVLTACDGDEVTGISIGSLSTGGTGDIKTGIYEISGTGAPSTIGALAGTLQDILNLSSSASFKTVSGLSIVLTEGTTYLVSVGDEVGTVSLRSDSGIFAYKVKTTTNLTDPWGAYVSYGTGVHYSFYATYTQGTCPVKTGDSVMWFD